MMNMNFRRMTKKLKQSARELEDLNARNLDDDFLLYEYQIKLNEISLIESLLTEMLDQPKEEEVSLLTE